MRARRLLFLGLHQLTAYHWQGGTLHDEGHFTIGPEGYAEFAAYLRHHSGCTFMLLANVAEEGYQPETIPYLQGRDRQAVIERKLGQYFFGASLACAKSLGYEKNKRKDERLLLTALTNPAFFAPWLAAFAEAQIALAGVYSLAQLAPLLLRRLKIAEPRCLVLSVQDQSIRQSYLENGELHFSRLTPLQNSSQAGIAQAFAAEAGKLQQYLTSQRLIGRDQALTAYVLAHAGTHKAIATSCIDTPQLNFVVIDSTDAARRTGLKTPPPNSFSDTLFLNLLAGAPPAQQYANDEQRHLHHLGQLRALLLGSATTVLGACLLYAGLQLYDRQAVAERSAELRAETQLARQRYDAIARTFPPMPTDSASLHQLIERHAELERASATPAGLYRDVARALHAAPTVEIDGIDWHLGAPRPNDARPAQAATPAAPASPSTTENATLRGNLRLGTSKTPRRQLEAFEHFVDALRANPALEVEVQRRPFDIEPGKSLKGSDIDSDDDKPRSFVLHLRRKPAT